MPLVFPFFFLIIKTPKFVLLIIFIAFDRLIFSFTAGSFLPFIINAPANILAHAGVVLGKNYPKPIADLKASRQRALDAYAETKGK